MAQYRTSSADLDHNLRKIQNNTQRTIPKKTAASHSAYNNLQDYHCVNGINH